MNHTQRLRSKKQRTKAQRQHQNRSKELYKRSKPPPEPKPPKAAPSHPPHHHPKLLDLTNVTDALALYLHNTITTHEQPKSRRPLFPRPSPHPSLFDARDTRSTSTIPSVPDIRNYVRDIIERRRLSAETVVVAVVLLTRTGLRIRSSNWARLLLVAFLLANKEAEDVYNVWNVRFVGIIPDLPLYEINLLEMEFLKSIKYRLHVEPNTFREFSDRLWQFLEPPEKIIIPELPKKGKGGGKKIENGLDVIQQQIFSILGKEGALISGDFSILGKEGAALNSGEVEVVVKAPLRPS